MIQNIIILFFLTLTLTSAAPLKSYYKNGALKSETIEHKLLQSYPSQANYIDTKSASKRSLEPKYIKAIIESGSSRLGFKKSMRSIYLPPKQQKEVINYIASGMQGKRPRAFSKCSGCHGPKGGGVSNIAPALFEYYTQEYHEYHPNGNRKVEATLINKHFQGEVRHYYPNGKLKTILHYNQGHIDGVAQEYFPSGKLKARVAFKNNHAVRGLQYGSQGTRSKMKRSDLTKFDQHYATLSH